MSGVDLDNRTTPRVRATVFILRDPPSIPTRRSLQPFVERARTLGTDPWPARSITRVVRRGQPLSAPIHYKGEQWAVTRYGVECRDGCYAIEISRIWEDEFDCDLYGWVEHMAWTKDWIDLPDFVEALRFARSLARAQEQLGTMRKPFFPWKHLPSCPIEALTMGSAV